LSSAAPPPSPASYTLSLHDALPIYALRFTPKGSPIEIGVGVDARRGVAHLSVIDHGPGIPAQQRAKIFQRFWRADTSRSRDSGGDRKSTRLNSSHVKISYAVFCLKK